MNETNVSKFGKYWIWVEHRVGGGLPAVSICAQEAEAGGSLDPD